MEVLLGWCPGHEKYTIKCNSWANGKMRHSRLSLLERTVGRMGGIERKERKQVMHSLGPGGDRIKPGHPDTELE